MYRAPFPITWHTLLMRLHIGTALTVYNLRTVLSAYTCLHRKTHSSVSPLCYHRTLRSRKQQSSSNSLSLSLSQAATPRKTLTFSAGNTPIGSSSSLQQSSTASDAAEITAIVEQPHLRQRTVTTTTTTTYVDGHWGKLE